GTPISPIAGQWTYSETMRVSSNCRTAVAHFEGGGFLVDEVAPAACRIVPGRGTAPFPCTSNGAQFSCPNRVSFTEDGRPQVDAVLTVHAPLTATLADHTAGTRQNV